MNVMPAVGLELEDKMCTYSRYNGKKPCCTLDCLNCMWHVEYEDLEEDEDDDFDPQTGDPYGWDDNEF